MTSTTRGHRVGLRDARRGRRRARPARSKLPSRLAEGLLGLLLAAHGSVAGATSPPAFDDPAPAVSNDGALQMAWSAARGEYEVELRQGGQRRIVYRGPIPSAHISGLSDGEYAVRVRARPEDAAWTAWSAPKLLTVDHHPLPLVWTLMGLGLLTFAATAMMVVGGSRRAG